MVDPDRKKYDSYGDLPSNSKKGKDDAKPKVGKVIKGGVKQRKKPLSRKFAEAFQVENTNTVKEYLIFDVVIPAVKDLIFSMITEGSSKFLFNDAVVSGRRGGKAGYKSYGSVSKTRNHPSSRERRQVRASDGFDFDEFILESKGDAELALDTMQELIGEYGQATVADLKGALEVSADYTDAGYGWTSMAQARAVRVQDGYVLKMPDPKPLSD